jgi:hypothetical protein
VQTELELLAKDEELLLGSLDEENFAELLLSAEDEETLLKELLGNNSSSLGNFRGGLSEQDKRKIAANRGRNPSHVLGFWQIFTKLVIYL